MTELGPGLVRITHDSVPQVGVSPPFLIDALLQNYQLTLWFFLESFAPHVQPFIAQIAMNHVVLKLVKPFNENVRGSYLLH